MHFLAHFVLLSFLISRKTGKLSTYTPISTLKVGGDIVPPKNVVNKGIFVFRGHIEFAYKFRFCNVT